MVPWRNRVGPSIAMAPMAAIWAFVVRVLAASGETVAERGGQRHHGQQELGVVPGLARYEGLRQDAPGQRRSR
ncbi:hypothetical protein SCYAM73S_02879 [Streptomyces cyaneofuscatus]